MNPVHYHVDGRRTLARYLNGPEVRQVYMVTVRPGVTTAWHGHRNQTDYWVVLEGILQVGLIAFGTEGGVRPDEHWLSGEHQEVLEISPFIWHGYHNPGPGLVKMLNMTTAAYDSDHPDELRRSPNYWANFWGHVEMK